jgi:2-polyprenyl-3-methyl-5-hydroxy-6-metoxy-1,4-benzoquinol methylase
MFVGNPVGETDLEQYYRQDYAQQSAHSYIKMQQENAVSNFRKIRRQFRKKGISSLRGLAVLDVGAGFGFLVAEFQKLGARARGLELSKAACGFARDRLGVDVTSVGLGQVGSDGERFDLITVCDVIEHLPRPRELLSRCRELLKPNGWLTIKTDNFGSLVARVMGLDFYRLTPVEHISLFTPVTLRELALRCGFKHHGTISWTPGYGVRWALKGMIRQSLSGEESRRPPDPSTKHMLGPEMCLLGKLTNPLFAAAAAFVDRGERGAEFITFLTRSE